MKQAGTDAPEIITISLSGLAVSFLFSAYKPLEFERSEDEKLGTKELFGLIILPKMMWIATAIATLGILLSTYELGHMGYKNALYIGGFSIVFDSIFSLILVLIGTKHLRATLPVYFRSLPVLLVVAYLLFG